MSSPGHRNNWMPREDGMSRRCDGRLSSHYESCSGTALIHFLLSLSWMTCQSSLKTEFKEPVSFGVALEADGVEETRDSQNHSRRRTTNLTITYTAIQIEGFRMLPSACLV